MALAGVGQNLSGTELLEEPVVLSLLVSRC